MRFGGVAMVIAVGVLFVAAQYKDIILPNHPRAVFWGERLGLTAFGLAWLTASHLLLLFDVLKPMQQKVAAVMRTQNSKRRTSLPRSEFHFHVLAVYRVAGMAMRACRVRSISPPSNE